jgi:hypothetical protein
MNALVRRAASPVPVLQLTNFGELVQFSQMAAKSRLVPPEYRGQPESVMLAVQLGSELGLSPMQSIQNIAVIGSGRPSGATPCWPSCWPTRTARTWWRVLRTAPPCAQ